MGLLRWGGSPKDRFARQVLRAVRATGRVSEAGYNADDFSIAYQIAGDATGGGHIYLENTFRETEGLSSREQGERIQRLVTAVVSSSTAEHTWEQARPRLRPVLRGVSFGAGVGDVQNAILSRPAMPFLMEAVVVDEPTSMAYVTRVRLTDWGVSEDEVFATARANLAAAAGRIDGPAANGPALLRFVDTGDAYFTSMLLVDGFLARLGHRVGGRPVAFVPDRDTLVVGSDAPTVLLGLYELVAGQYTQANRSVSPVGYTVDDRGAVVPYATAPGTALAAAVHRAEVLLAASQYSAQKEALDAQHERDDIDIFVASLLIAEPQDEPVFSIAVWSQDVDTLLPQADLIRFQPTDPDAASTAMTVPFDVVAREAALVAEPDYTPPRYRVTAWPGEPTIARLRGHAVNL